MSLRVRPALWAVSLVVLALSTVAPLARADVGGAAPKGAGAAPPAETLALDLFEQSAEAYERGRFDQAISLLKRAYAIKPEPVLLYNLGRAYEGAGDLGAAATAYADYLKSDPTLPDRGAIERRIATLRAQLSEREELRKRASVRSGPRVAPLVFAAGGTLTLVAGVVLGLVAREDHDQAAAEPSYRAAEELQGRAERLATGANVCFLAGGVLLATALATLLLLPPAHVSRVPGRVAF